MNSKAISLFKFISRSILFILVIAPLIYPSTSTAQSETVYVRRGHSEIIVFPVPIKRISITNPDIADASVTTPTQLLINGKLLGTTSMIIWNEDEEFRNYIIVVNNDGDSRQVMLQVRFAEIKKSALHELGFDFLFTDVGIAGETLQLGSFAGKVSAPNIPLLLTETVDMFIAIPTQNISTIIKALEQRNLLTTLANPNLTAIDGSEASFLAGGEFPVPIVQGSAGLQTVTIVFKEFGIRLRFIPTVLDETLINIRVATEVSSLDFENGIILSGFRVPALMTRKTETTVEINDGQHFVIGGLISNISARTTSGIPILWRIPLIGRFFSSRRIVEEETELVVLITPHLVRQNTLFNDQ